MIPSSDQLSNNMLEQWILPVFYKKDEQGEKDTIGGQCFLVNNFLVTAAHVINDDWKEPYIQFGEKNIPLKKEDAIAYSYTPIIENLGDYEDFAIFPLHFEIKSPLIFSEIEIESNLLCYYCHKDQQEKIDIYDNTIFSIIEKPQTSNEIHIFTSLATFDNIISQKLFLCKVSPILAEGDSGCPILTTDNKVLGLLIGVRKEDIYIHVFQSAAYIKKILNLCIVN